MLDEWRAAPVGTGSGDERAVSVPGKPSALAGEEAVEYRARLLDPRDGDDEVACLHLNGLFAHATVDVPGEVVDSRVSGAEAVGATDGGAITHDAYFEPLRIPFRPDGDEGEVVVTCEAPEDRFGGLFDTDLVPDEERVPGIWWEARVESHSLPYVDAMRVRPEVDGEDAVLHVETRVVTDGPLDERLTYSVRPAGETKARGMMERAAIDVDAAGVHTFEHTVEMRDPARWWPAGYGEQHRYTLRAKLADDEHSVTTGICEVEREDGHLVVNGQRVPIRGVNLVTAHPMDVGRATDCNANLVRAHAQALPPDVYEACDEEGLLVWQDLPLTGPESFDVDRAKAVGRSLLRSCGSHPSVAVVGVHDDPAAPFASGLGSGFLDRLRLRWRAWRTGYDRGPAEDVAGSLETSRPVVPVIGPPGTDPDAGAYYPGWDYGRAEGAESLLDRYPVDVLAEFGAGALGSDGDSGTDDGAIAGFDRAKHDEHVAADDDPEASQAYQAEVLETVAETLRTDRRGAVAFALRDTDAAGFGVYTADGQQKTGATALARAFQPVQAFLADPRSRSSEIVVVNDAPRELTAEVAWSAGDAGESETVTVDATGRWQGPPIEAPRDAETVELAVTVGDTRVANSYDL